MRRIRELDALRGLAAVAILSYHLWFPGFGFLATAVDLFFVMSGFLITSIILRQRSQPDFLKTFYTQRAARIFPVYYLGLIGFVVLNALLPTPAALDGLPWYLTYTQHLPDYWSGVEPAFSPAFGHTWSLAIEEQFYLVWPVLLYFWGRRGVVALGVSMIVLAFSLRVLGFSTWILATRCDGLALGGLLALALEERESRPREFWRARSFAIVSLIALGSLIPESSVLRFVGLGTGLATRSPIAASIHYLAINLLYFGVIGWIVRMSGSPMLGILRNRQLVALGSISYSLYFYHYIVINLLDRSRGWLGLSPGLGRDIVTVALSLAIATISWKLIERPLLKRHGRPGEGNHGATCESSGRFAAASDPVPQKPTPRLDFT